jgi:5-methylcytosine-specific restriction endonuclease McrA
MSRMCLERCGRLALPGRSRCARCIRGREQVRNAQPKRRAYNVREYRDIPVGGVCHRCGRGGADTRDHIVPLDVQMKRFGEVRDLRWLPAHRSCNSSRGSGPIGKVQSV